jgi:uncharacterized protein YjbI with pentapeptide repeats
MTRSKRPDPSVIGATLVPDLVPETLEDIEVAELSAQFELEGVRLSSSALNGADAGSGRFERAHLRDVDLEDSKLRALELVDVRGERFSAANGDWGGAALRRVAFQKSRMTGLNLGEARIEEARFEGCKLDYANFRHCVIEHVSFEDCVLANADFQGARIYAARFSGCQLTAADFTKAELAHVDLRGSELALAGSVLGLRGATIDSLQLMDLSRTIAHELGIVVIEA